MCRIAHECYVLWQVEDLHAIPTNLMQVFGVCIVILGDSNPLPTDAEYSNLDEQQNASRLRSSL